MPRRQPPSTERERSANGTAGEVGFLFSTGRPGGNRVVLMQTTFPSYDFSEIKQQSKKEAVMPRGGRRPGAGRPRKLKTDAAAPPKQPEPAAASPPGPAAEQPLAFMLKVMNDVGAPAERRDRMAVAAAPYVHPKVGEQGKKAAKDEAARTVAASTRFGAGAPPKVTHQKARPH